MRLLFSHELTQTQGITPEWAEHIERWYQLDPPSFVLADGYWKNRESLIQKPDWIFLASPEASNYTDHQFATELPSPAKFVHTLPNVRAAALLRLMDWAGPVLCLQDGKNTLETAISEAKDLARQEAVSVWVASVAYRRPAWTAALYAV